MKRRRCGLLVALAVVVAVAFVGFADQQSAGAAGSGTSGLAVAKKRLDALYKGTGFKQPPARSPKPARGKTVWVITVGLLSTGSTDWANGARDAGKALGWKVKIFDGKFSPSQWLLGVQQAIAAKADGILLMAVDCSPIKTALQQARAAGIKVAAIDSADCSDAKKGAPALFDGTVQYASTAKGTFKGHLNRVGAAQADWVTVKTKGKGKIILITRNEALHNGWQTDGFQQELKKVCPGCSIVQKLDLVLADFNGQGVRQKMEQSLLQHREATGLIVLFDDMMTSAGGDAAVRGSGMSNKLNVIGAVGYKPSLKQIRDNAGLDATAAWSLQWESWAGMDTLNRLFNGGKQANSGLAVGMVDRGHNDQSKTGFVPPVDFKSAYRKAWNGR